MINRIFIFLLIFFSGLICPSFADDLPTIELPYFVSIKYFKIFANGKEVAVPVNKDNTVKYKFSGTNNNTIKAELCVTAKGIDKILSQITFNGEDYPDIDVKRNGADYIYTASKSVGPFEEIKIGYFVEVKPRVLTPNTDNSAFDEEGGISIYTSSKIVAAIDNALFNESLHKTDCLQAVRAYFRSRPTERFIRWTVAQVASNLADLAFIYFGGGFISEAVENAIEAKWVISTWKKWLILKLSEIAAGTTFNFAKSLMSDLIQRGEIVLPNLPSNIFKSFVNACFGSAVAGMYEWEGLWANFVAAKIADVETAAAFAAWKNVAGEDAPPLTPEGEKIIDNLKEGVNQAEELLKQRGIAPEYFRFGQDETDITFGDIKRNIRVFGAQWLVSGEGAIIVICRHIPDDPSKRRGFLIRFKSGHNGVIHIPEGKSGITEFKPVDNAEHDPEELAKELISLAKGKK